MILTGSEFIRIKDDKDEQHVVVDLTPTDSTPAPRQMSIGQLCRLIYPSIPNKSLFLLGIFLSIIMGICTPFFSVLLAQLMSKIGAPDAGPVVLETPLLILLVALVDGLGNFGKFYALKGAE